MNEWMHERVSEQVLTGKNNHILLQKIITLIFIRPYTLKEKKVIFILLVWNPSLKWRYTKTQKDVLFREESLNEKSSD